MLTTYIIKYNTVYKYYIILSKDSLIQILAFDLCKNIDFSNYAFTFFHIFLKVVVIENNLDDLLQKISHVYI